MELEINSLWRWLLIFKLVNETLWAGPDFLFSTSYLGKTYLLEVWQAETTMVHSVDKSAPVPRDGEPVSVCLPKVRKLFTSKRLLRHMQYEPPWYWEKRTTRSYTCLLGVHKSLGRICVSPKSFVTTLFHALFIFIELILHLHTIVETRHLRWIRRESFSFQKKERHKFLKYKIQYLINITNIGCGRCCHRNT